MDPGQGIPVLTRGTARHHRLSPRPPGRTPAGEREAAALQELASLNDACFEASSKYKELVEYLKSIGIGPRSDKRAVVFSERVATLGWLQEKLTQDLRLKRGQVDVLHGGLVDDQQQDIVESFKQTNSPIRVLVTGDVASEGVNLHKQCHHLIHYDIPWSLIRIEQRNGRIDRYGQRERPQITALLLDPSHERFAGDIRVLTKLVEREQEAHEALGDVASIMGKYQAAAEEEEIRKTLAGIKSFDDVVPELEQATDGMPNWLDELLAADTADADESGRQDIRLLYPEPVDFLRDALRAYYPNPEDNPQPGDRGGVGWRELDGSIVEFVPPRDLLQRLEVLPQTYLSDRKVAERLRLVTEPYRANTILDAALSDDVGSSWPEAHFLGPLHPVLDWAADRALSTLGRGEVFAVRGAVSHPAVLLNGTLLNRRGQVVASSWLLASFETQRPGVHPFPTAAELLDAAGVLEPATNPGPVRLPDLDLIGPAVDAASGMLQFQLQAAEADTERRVNHWLEQADHWQHEAEALVQRSSVKQNRARVDQLAELSHEMKPDRQLVRPLLVVLPSSTEVANG